MQKVDPVEQPVPVEILRAVARAAQPDLEHLVAEEAAILPGPPERRAVRDGPRNLGRGPAFISVNMNVGKAFKFGKAIEPQAPGDLTPRDKMRELVAWFLGDTCGRLRHMLGVALG